jgi:hypothetical protein
MATKPEWEILPIRRPSRDYLGVSEERRKWERAARDAEEMTPRELEKRCARAAAKAGKFLASARAIIEPELPYFLELRWRLNAQGQRGGVEGWQRWCEKHFSCDVRTVNRALSSILGPEKERKKTRKWREPAEALIAAVEPAIRLARKHPEDPDADEFLSSLDTTELSGLVPEPQARAESLIDRVRREKRIKTEELYKMGLHLAHAVVDGSRSVRNDTPEGKKILGLATHMLEVESEAEKPQDKMSRSPGSNFVMDDDDLPLKLKVHNYYLVHVGIEDGKPIIGKYLGMSGEKHQFQHRMLGPYNVRDIGKVVRPANEKEIAEERAWEAKSKRPVQHVHDAESKIRKAHGSM